MVKISLEKINDFFAAVAAHGTLYIPVDTSAGAKYEKWENDKKLSDALNTVRSPKDFFFPQTENLMEFKTEGKKIEIIDTRTEHEDFVVFGVRACDVKSFDVLDKVFLSEPVDSFYKNRREHAVTVSLACTKPHETCFCGTFGIDAAEPGGDVVCYKTADALYLDAKTEKGEKLLASVASVTEKTEKADEAEVEEQKKTVRDRLSKLPYSHLSLEGWDGNATETRFDSPLWEELYKPCLACGTCTFVCPTCQCYDIKDFNTGHGVKRFRCWDSCMYSDFTKMSAGQPRLTQLERFRQRFMHKLVYFPTNNDGMFSCVGCGRCINKCPIQMNIVKVMKKLGGGENG